MATKRHRWSDFNKQYYISLTEYCNWKCSYCDFPTLENHHSPSIDQALKSFDMLKEATNHDQMIEYGLEGGELGILSQDYLDQIFAHDLAETYVVCTNGLFMERGYHDRYADKLHYIMHHVQPDITLNQSIPQYEYDPSIQVDYTFVIDKPTLYSGAIEKILTENPHPTRQFIIHVLQPRKPGLDLLTIEDFKYLHSILDGRTNVNPWFIKRVERIIKNLDNTSWLNSRRTICANSFQQPIFDLTNNRINRCCISITGDSIPYTLENLKKLYKNEKVFPNVNDKVCDGCIAGFLWSDERIDDVYLDAMNIIHQFAIEENNKNNVD